MNETLNKAYSIGRATFIRTGKITPSAVSVEMKTLIRESNDTPILDILDAYSKGNHDENMAQSDIALIEGGSFSAEELAAFPSAGTRIENEEKFNYAA